MLPGAELELQFAKVIRVGAKVGCLDRTLVMVPIASRDAFVGLRARGKMRARMDDVGHAYTRGRAAHPRLKVAADAFGRHYARAIQARGQKSEEGLAVEDLYLACACANGVAGAAAAFEAKYGKILRRAVARVLSNPTERDEAVQNARQVLLVGSETSGPKIGTYTGQGPLEHWVAVAAIRLAISHGRAESAERRLRERVSDNALGGDPELLLVKGQIRQEFQAAVKEALGRLDNRARLVLKLWLVSGSTLANIGKAFGVTQQTVSRWMADARDQIFTDVRDTLAERLKIARDELPSFARLIGSQLDISISRLLGSEKT